MSRAGPPSRGGSPAATGPRLGDRFAGPSPGERVLLDGLELLLRTLGPGASGCSSAALWDELVWLTCSLRHGALAALRGLAPRALACAEGWLSAPAGSGSSGWDALHAWRDSLHAGGPGVRASGLSLHCRAKTPWLARQHPDNDSVRRSLELILAGAQQPGASPELLGATQELLLDHQIVRAPVDSVVVQRRGRRHLVPHSELGPRDRVFAQLPAGAHTLSRWRGARKGVGAYYSPTLLVAHLVREALPQVDACSGAVPRVVDPAMGGGVFLLEVLRSLCGRGPRRSAARQEHAVELARRGLHGVDCSRLAVAVARAALWLEVGAPEIAAPELLPHLHHGDALLGVGPNSSCPGDEGGAAGAADALSVVSAAGSPPLDWPGAYPEVLGREAAVPRGFDAVLGNPPWEILKARSPDFFERHAPRLRTMLQPAAERSRRTLLQDPGLAAAWERYRAGRQGVCRALRASGRYTLQGRGDLATYKLFLELALQLVRPGGRLGLVLPDALLRDLGAAPLRRALFERERVHALHIFDNRGLFPIHRSWRVLLLSAERAAAPASGGDHPFELAWGLSDPAWLSGGPHRSPQPLHLRPSQLAALAPESLAVPLVTDAQELVALTEQHRRGVALGSPCAGWPGLRFARELDLTLDADLFGDPGAGRVALWEGKRIHQYRLDHAEARYWLDPDRLPDRVTPRGNHRHVRLAYRAVARGTDAWTGIAALLPAGAPAGNSLHVVRAEGVSPFDQLWALAWLNSFVLNDLLRRSVGANLSMYHVAGLPIVPPDAAPAQTRSELLDAAGRLVVGGPLGSRLRAFVAPALQARGCVGRSATQRTELRATVEASVAWLAGVDGPRLAELLERFPLVDPALKVATARRHAALGAPSPCRRPPPPARS